MTVKSVTKDEAAQKAKVLLELLNQHSDTEVLWIEDVDEFSDSDKLKYYTAATHKDKANE